MSRLFLENLLHSADESVGLKSSIPSYVVPLLDYREST